MRATAALWWRLSHLFVIVLFIPWKAPTSQLPINWIRDAFRQTHSYSLTHMDPCCCLLNAFFLQIHKYLLWRKQYVKRVLNEFQKCVESHIYDTYEFDLPIYMDTYRMIWTDYGRALILVTCFWDPFFFVQMSLHIFEYTIL